MTSTPAPDPRPDIDPVQVGAAIGVTAATGAGYWFTDAYTVTYTGVPAHLTLSALARRDLTGGIYPDLPAAAVGIRATARTLIDWFTSPHVDPQHAEAFAALPPLRVCELVVYLCLHGDADALNRVGPESLRHYTHHLLHDPVPDPRHPLPRLVDQPYRPLAGTDTNPGTRLQVAATAPHNADTVAVPMWIDAGETITWHFTTPVPIPVDQLNALLLHPDTIAEYLSDHLELIDHHLAYRDSDTEHGIEISARLADPTTTALDTAPARPTEVELFFTGPDRDRALRTEPFGNRRLAEKAATADDRIFNVRAEIDPATAHDLPFPPPHAADTQP